MNDFTLAMWMCKSGLRCKDIPDIYWTHDFMLGFLRRLRLLISRPQLKLFCGRVSIVTYSSKELS